MSDDQVGCEWVSVSSGTGLPGLSRTKAVKQLCVYVYSVHAATWLYFVSMAMGSITYLESKNRLLSIYTIKQDLIG